MVVPRYFSPSMEFVTSGRLLVQFSFIETTGRRTARLCWTVPDCHRKSSVAESVWADIVSVVRHGDSCNQLSRWLRGRR